MDFGLYISASGMVAEQAREGQIANNLANATTPGYKPSEANVHSFGRLLLENTATGQPVGNFYLGVETGPEYVDLEPDPVHETGRPLDFAVEGEGFFAVRTPAGVRYTRNGQFAVNGEGILTDAFGNPVLNQAGAPIRVGPGGRVAAAELGLFRLANPLKAGENLFTGVPVGRANGRVRAGALEEAGVSPVQALVEMVTAYHDFQAGQQAIAAIGQTLQEAATQVGSLNGG
jgi:flagellar basal-body rod protein FlgF